MSSRRKWTVRFGAVVLAAAATIGGASSVSGASGFSGAGEPDPGSSFGPNPRKWLWHCPEAQVGQYPDCYWVPVDSIEGSAPPRP